MLEELAKKREKAELDKNSRYQLFEIRNNLEEIRTMSERTCDYVVSIYPELVSIPEWSIIPRVVMEFVKASFDHLKAKRKKDISETFIEIDNFIHFGIEFGTTDNADKDATFNPIITTMGELLYDNTNPDNNKISKDAPILNLTNDIEFVAISAKNVLQNRFGLIIEDWRSIVYIFVAFCRVAKEYLVKNKDNDEVGIIINIGEVIDVSIEKYGADDDHLEYAINFGPGKTLKMDYAKSDEISENNN